MMLQCMRHLRCLQSVFKGSNDLQISLLHPRLSHFHHCWHLGTQDGPSKYLSPNSSSLPAYHVSRSKNSPSFYLFLQSSFMVHQCYGKIKGFWSKAQFNMLVAEVTEWSDYGLPHFSLCCILPHFSLCCIFLNFLLATSLTWSLACSAALPRTEGLRFIPHGLVRGCSLSFSLLN